MVMIHLKSALTDSNDEFLFETKTSSGVDSLIDQVVKIHNSRLRANLIVDTVRGLSMYGLMKQNPDDETSGKIVDPSGLRTGNPPDEQMADLLRTTSEELSEYVAKEQVGKKVALVYRKIDDKINAVRDAVATAYPTGLPEWEATGLVLDEPLEKLNLPGSLTESNAALYAFNKEFIRGQLISDRLGTNEKTKVICKLTRKEAGPPPREAIVSEAERSAIAMFYLKRQEELKKLADADDDDYLNSAWADPRGMKKSLQGLSSIRAPGRLG